MKEQILKALSIQKFINVDQICKIARIFDASAKKKAQLEIATLVETGEIVRTERGKYCLPEHVGVFKGTVIGNINGFCFVRPLDRNEEDVFVPERNMNGACHGDVVSCKIEQIPFQRHRFRKGEKQTRSQQGEIIQIIKRGTTRVVGMFRNNGVYSCVIPDDRRFANEVFIANENTLNSKSNEKVCVEILRYPSRRDTAEGKVIEVLGDASNLMVSTLSIVRSFGYDDVFPEETLLESKKVAQPVSQKELDGRTDFRNDLVITIDGEDARDFDDAIHLKKEGENYHLDVHIADVTHYVKENGAVDKEAFKRGTSVYFPDHVIPMLPEVLSNGMCSLNPNEDRLTLSVSMKLDKNGEIIDHKIHKGVIKSAHRMTYTSVTKILEGDKEEIAKYKDVEKMLIDSAELAQKLIKRRDKMGQLDFDLPETQIDVNEKYETINIRKKPRTISERLIEQFMLITNEVVAIDAVKAKWPFVFRVHESPTSTKLSEFCDFATGLGLKIQLNADSIKPKDLQKILLEIKGQPFENVLNKIMLRSMQKAIYFDKCMGHFGLACHNYCHFTSPIRRYPDLTIHRIIKLFLDGKLTIGKQNALSEFVISSSEQSSVTEQKADEVERAVDNLKKAEFMSKKIGEIYTGVISGVVENGFFVELDNTVEGMVTKDMLPQDNYYFEEKRLRIVGKKHIYSLGDTIAVKVFSVDILLAKINFELANDSVFEKKEAVFTKKQPKSHKN